MDSPYNRLPEERWKTRTEALVRIHPLSIEEIKDVSLAAWNLLWTTQIGSGDTVVPLREVDVPAPVVGYFFEKLVARKLEQKYPGEWRGNDAQGEKDLVYLRDESCSFEIKSSGQLGDKVYGNRSYTRESENEDADPVSRKSKSGYYLTVNFHHHTLMLLRFGWLDLSDWTGQASQTGQAAALSDAAYESKLIDIPGEYRLKSPIGMLEGVGKKTAEVFRSENVHTVQELLEYGGRN